ncbi:MAG: DUF3455 domain-containing protein [Polaromonas sp.]|uniref:DUF3455 domain-containing protein n=1 Tax=Polaromonas sp. TaxID=1869339 RepID=UPI0017D08F65|nr:DUF3455 domain-containing protein [Polaromonas sp.]MBA3595534.1 DUF3455 domain-containing protein [Polaromonas sp.]
MNTHTGKRSSVSQMVGLLLAAGALTLMAGCSAPRPPLSEYLTQQPALPGDIRVPAGHQAVLEARGIGQLQYECQATNRSPWQYAWLPLDRSIELRDSFNNTITLARSARSWVHRDGSELAVREFVEVDNGIVNLPLQRARVEPSSLPGTLNNISYIQRVRTLGGLPSIRNCSAAELGMRVRVPYEADYVFWRQLSS